ncbi:hypothetical protein Tco_1280815, partial [Tanacetum coccineum]
GRYTPGGTTYWEPNVDEPYLPLEGKRFDTIEECVKFYSVYAENGGFEVKKSAQKKTKSGRDIKVKKSQNEQKPTRNEETSTRERFEANFKSRIKTVVEKRQESRRKDKSLKEKV